MSQIARQDILERDAPCQITESDYGGRQLDSATASINALHSNSGSLVSLRLCLKLLAIAHDGPPIKALLNQ